MGPPGLPGMAAMAGKALRSCCIPLTRKSRMIQNTLITDLSGRRLIMRQLRIMYHNARWYEHNKIVKQYKS